MSDLSRGERVRRGGRRPGWALLTVLLVLAIVASSALVFTSKVELLRLAVILSLWAAVVAAFVSVIYRRQSDLDQAKARDLKMVYDLQLDREISARREYELGIESHLRRELAHEIRDQANEEVAALRAELAALRNNLEILFGADLSHRPAIEPERGYTDWEPGDEWKGDASSRPDRVSSTRITEVRDDADRYTEIRTADTAESPIIDVPEEPLFAGGPLVEAARPERAAHRRAPEAPEAQGVPDVERTMWIPPVTPGAPPPSPHAPRWTPPPAGAAPAFTAPAGGEQVEQVEGAERRGRHATGPDESVPRHGAEDESVSRHGAGDESVSRHGAEDESATGGQSVAELLARLQHSGPTEGGRRRRRED